jgi:hypothetical protein
MLDKSLEEEHARRKRHEGLWWTFASNIIEHINAKPGLVTANRVHRAVHSVSAIFKLDRSAR